MFVVKACFKGKVLGRGEGPSKKEAQQMAAKEAMEKIINE
jgi:dsRNA-specific ribonuclease